MAKILFVNTCELFDDFRLEDEIFSILKNCAHELNVEQEDLFLLTKKGAVCCEESFVNDNCLGKGNYLFLFQKKFINTEAIEFSKDWREFSDFPVDPQRRFDFSEFDVADFSSQSDDFEVIRTNEEILYEAMQGARRVYAEYFTNAEVIEKNFGYAKFRTLVVKGLWRMFEKFCLDFQNSFKGLSRDVTELKKNISNFQRTKLMAFLSSPNTFELLNSFFARYNNVLARFESNLLKFQKRFIADLDNELGKQVHSLSAMKNIYTSLEKIVRDHAVKVEDTEASLGYTLRVCRKYKKFKERLLCLTVENYHPKTPIVKKLKRSEKVFDLSGEVSGSREVVIDSTKVVEAVNANYVKISNLFKKIVEYVSSFSYRLNFKAKTKLERYRTKYMSLKEVLENVSRIEQSPNFDRQLSSFSSNIERYNESYYAAKILDQLSAEKQMQSEFLDTFGKILPVRCYWPLTAKMVTNTLPENSFGGLSRVKESLVNLTLEEIRNFYKAQTDAFEAQTAAEVHTKSQSIKEVEKEISDLNEEIEELEKQRLINKEKLENVHEEVCLMSDKSYSADRFGKTGMLKLEFLRFKQKVYIRSKMDVIKALRNVLKENQNTFTTAS